MREKRISVLLIPLQSGVPAQINRCQSVSFFPNKTSAGFPPFFMDRPGGGWIRRRGGPERTRRSSRRQREEDSRRRPGDEGFFPDDFPYDPMKSSNSPSLSPPFGGEEGSRIGGFPFLATVRRKVRVPAASRAAKKQQLRFAFTIDLPTTGKCRHFLRL